MSKDASSIAFDGIVRSTSAQCIILPVRSCIPSSSGLIEVLKGYHILAEAWHTYNPFARDKSEHICKASATCQELLPLHFAC